MNKLLAYYQRELNFLKQHGKAFAARFPKIAHRLGIVDGESEDPHVERIIESFALLTSRIHQRLDDDMPEVTEALLTTVAPQFLRAMPSTCIISIEPNRQTSSMTEASTIAAGTLLYSRNFADVVCRFQTIYPINLLPLSIEHAKLHFDNNDLYWHLNLNFQVWSGAGIGTESLRLYLHGPSNAVNILYTLMCSEINRVTLYQEGNTLQVDSTAISAVGFKPQDGLINQDTRVAPIHLLLREYFSFPQKFYFLDIQMPASFTAKANTFFTLDFIFNRSHLTHTLDKLTASIDTRFFRLNCSPAINLFTLRGEPMTVTESTAEYKVIPDINSKQNISVWAINHVYIQRKINDTIVTQTLQPLLGFDHSCAETNMGVYWQSFVRESMTANGSERNLFIALSNRNGQPTQPKGDLITFSLACTNMNIPNQMKNGHPDGDFDSDIPLADIKIYALNRPTRQVLPPNKNEMHWRLISQLSLNYMLLSNSQGAKFLRETLMLYNFDDTPAVNRMINMLINLEVEPVTARLVRNAPQSLARGIAITLTFDHEALNEPEYYLMCCFLDHYLGLLAPVNSFTQVTTQIEHEEYTRRICPIRAGKLSWI